MRDPTLLATAVRLLAATSLLSCAAGRTAEPGAGSEPEPEAARFELARIGRELGD